MQALKVNKNDVGCLMVSLIQQFSIFLLAAVFNKTCIIINVNKFFQMSQHNFC